MEHKKEFTGKKHAIEQSDSSSERVKSNKKRKTFTSSPDSDSDSEVKITKVEKKESTVNPYTGRQYSKKYYDILQKRKALPAFDAKDNILKLIEENQILIIQGETGSGKTTQIPQFLLSAGYNKGIAVTQPRRVAAMSVARRVAEELDVELGDEIGYTIRFEDKSSQKTLIKYVTDGMLLREAIADPLLKRYCVIIIDEAHERTLATDILFGFLKEILPKRPELKMIVMSATLDITKFQEYFNAPLIIIPGRTYPVEKIYLKQPVDDYFEASVSRVVQIHKDEKEGDILLFLTGEEEIESACAEIRSEIAELGDEVGYANVIPLYSTLPPYLQQKIFDNPPGKNKKGKPGRKIIVATNIAETSITIDGIVYVVDPGFSKQKIYNPRSKMESLLVSPISQESADQRAGRAGRTRPGKCYRLYTEESYKNDLRKATYPEILRSNITTVVLNLKKLGINDLVHFDFIDPPAPETMMRALEMLSYLGAIDEDANLTPLGAQMSQLPLEPELAKMLLSGVKHKCTNDILSICALLSVQNPFLRPKDKEAMADQAKNKFSHHLGDHFTLLLAYNSYKLNNSSNEWCRENFINQRSMKAADDIRNQLVKILIKMGFEVPDNKFSTEISVKRQKKIIKSLIEGFFAQVAHLETNGYYITVKDNQYVFIHPSSVLVDTKPKWVLYNEFVLTSKNYIRTLTAIEARMMLEIAPDYFNLDSMALYAYKRDLMEEKKKMDAENSDDD